MGIEAGTAAIIGAVVSAIGSGVAAYESDRQRSASNKAADRQLEQAKKDAALQSEQFARQNRKSANIEGLLEGNSADLNPTNLTGAEGAAVNQNQLGKTSLLGG